MLRLARMLSPDHRQLTVLVEWRRRWQRPFQGCCSGAPGVVAGSLLARESMGHSEEEHQRAKSGEIRPQGGDQVPIGESVGVIDDPPRHAGEAEKCCGKKTILTPMKVIQKCSFPIVSEY